MEWQTVWTQIRLLLHKLLLKECSSPIWVCTVSILSFKDIYHKYCRNYFSGAMKMSNYLVCRLKHLFWSWLSCSTDIYQTPSEISPRFTASLGCPINIYIAPDKWGCQHNTSPISGWKQVCCGYLLEVPLEGASNKYPQHTCFRPEIREKRNNFWLKKVPYLDLWKNMSAMKQTTKLILPSTSIMCTYH